MTTLSLALLGSFGATLGARPLDQFRTNKVQALLIYLVAEAPAMHRREAIMELLWPGLPQPSAQVNLRQIIYQLHKLIPDMATEAVTSAVPLLLAERQTVQLNPDYPITSDVAAFTGLLRRSRVHIHTDLLACADCQAWLEEAVALYRGDFLADFSLYDSNSYEAWSQVKRESLHRQMLDALDTLTLIYTGQADYRQAEASARRQLEMDNYRESAYRQLMRVLALSGRRSEALVVYENGRRLLSEELGMAPAVKTTALYEQIRAGDLSLATPAPKGIRGYELQEKIGEGAFGAVHRAYQKGVGREVAVKIIHPQYANQPDFIRRFEAEARLVARLEHPHIVPLYDYWREPDSAYLVMRWLRGGSLQSALAERPYPAATALTLIEQIAAALHTAHCQGIVHRDVKPSNILLDGEGNAYLSDFGIAKDTSTTAVLTSTHELVGSPAYISPEQLLGEVVTPATDIYSLGLVLFEMLTGARAFTTTSLVELIQKQVNEPMPLVCSQRPDLPPAVDDVIQRATAKKASERFPDAPALAAAFREAIQQNGHGRPATIAAMDTIPESEIVNPYKGLRPFLETDAVHFFGRTALVQQLLSRFCSSSNLPLTLPPSPSQGEGRGGDRFLAVVGPSGCGKSSVVKAGLIPALRAGAVPGSESWFVAEMVPGSHPLEELEAALMRVAVNPPPSLLEPLQKDERGLARVLKRILPQESVNGNRLSVISKENRPPITDYGLRITGPSQLLLVIDQFEELFTLVTAEADRLHFINLLLAALAEPHSRLWLVLTLRADFYDRPLQYTDLGELLRQRTELVLPLTPAELEQAITRPAASVGVACESALVTAMTTEVNEQPGALPLLQYALTELFERRDGRTLTLAAYGEIGGVTGALARRADEIYDSLTADGRAATRQLFLRLITLGEGVEDTRRRVRLSELEGLSVIGNQLSVNSEPITDYRSPITAFGHHRLLTFDRDPISREPTVEVAHEALLREWGRLRDWLDESRADVRLQRLLAGAAAEWHAAVEDQGFLLRGSRLDQFEGWAEQTDVALTQDERAFLEASLAARRQRRAEEETRRQHELETARHLAETERQRAEEQTRAAARLRQRAVYLAGALVIAALLAITAVLFQQRAARNAETAVANANTAATQEANAQANAELAAAREVEAVANAELAATREAEALVNADMAATRRAEAVGEANLRATAEAVAVNEQQEALRQASIGFAAQALTELDNKFPERAIPLALEALENYPYTWQAERALGQAVLESRLELILSEHTAQIRKAAWSPDSTKIATASEDGTAIVWDGQTGQELFTLLGHTDVVYYLAWSPDGDRLVTTSFDGTARLWDAATGTELFILPHEGRVFRAAWSPDGAQIITSARDGTATIWDATTGEKRLTLLEGSEAGLYAVAWSPDGRQVATGDFTGKMMVWDAETGDTLFPLEGHENFINQILWSPSGDRIVSASDDNTARIWDANTGEVLHTLAGHTGWIANAVWSPEGDRIATASDDASVRMWNADNGENIFVFDPGDLLGDSGYPNYLAWSPDGNFLATNRFDGAITILNSATGSIVYDLTGHTSSINCLDWSADGDHLVAGSGDGTARVWDVSPRAQILRGHTSTLNSSGWSLDGARFATNSFDGTARIWDTETWQELLVISADENALWMLRWDSTGERISTQNFEGQMKVWDAASGELLREMEIAPGFGGMDWSPLDSRLVAAGADGIARMWDVDSGEMLLTFEGHEGEQITCVDWSPDGQLVVTSDIMDRAIVWNANSGEEVTRLQVEEGIGWMTQAVWSPDGKLIATHSDDPVGGRIWDVATGEVLYTFTGHSGSVWSLEWSLSGDRLLTAGGDATARIWDAHSGAELLVYTFADWPAAHWSPNNQQIAFPLGDGTAWVVDVQWQNVDELIAYARACCLVRELTSEERLQFGLDSEE